MTVGAISAGTSLLGGIFGSNAASKAAKIQAQAAQRVADMATAASGKAATGVTSAAKAAATGVTTAASQATADVTAATTRANNLLASTYGTEAKQLQPYLTAGGTAANNFAAAIAPGGSLATPFSFNAADITKDPGYQFQLQQGLQALERSAAARGELQGGGTLKALTQYAQGLAGTEFQNAYNRALTTFQTNRGNTFQTLMGGIGVGENAANQFGTATRNYGNQGATNITGAGYYGGNTLMNAARYAGDIGFQGAGEAGQFGLEGAQIAGNALMSGANARAAGVVGAQNSWNAALGGIGNAAMQGWGMYNLMNPPQVSGTVSGSAPNSWAPVVSPGPYYNPAPAPPPYVGPSPYDQNSMAAATQPQQNYYTNLYNQAY